MMRQHGARRPAEWRMRALQSIEPISTRSILVVREEVCFGTLLKYKKHFRSCFEP
jgi:hypothetical protein